jgi:hypothetical protein
LHPPEKSRQAVKSNTNIQDRPDPEKESTKGSALFRMHVLILHCFIGHMSLAAG